MRNIKSIPIFIISFNRLDSLKQQIECFEKFGYRNIHIIDNQSSYPPLLEYYKTIPYTVHMMDKNYGHTVLFKAKEFRKIITEEYFVLTDCDVLPVEECPEDFLQIFMNILNRRKDVTKVGFSLKIDDIPDHYQLKKQVLQWEGRFYYEPINEKECVVYNSDIDTTFALYRPIKSFKKFNKKFYKAIRTGYPYTARHLPWYKDLENLNEEDIFYQQTASNNISNWNGVLQSHELDKKHLTNKCYLYRVLLFFVLPLLRITKIKDKKITVSFCEFEIFKKEITNLEK